jgi:metal-sulfur cluster biosynthetic enzyme
MSPEMKQKIENVLERVNDPESDLPIAQLGLVNRLLYSEKEKKLLVFTSDYSNVPNCLSCAVIGWTMMATIIRDLTTEFQKEFPDLTIEFV